MESVMHPAEKSAYQSVSLEIIIVNGRDAIHTSGDDPYSSDTFTDDMFTANKLETL